MKAKLILTSFLLAASIIVLIKCGTEKKEVLLRLKFNENQILRWATSSKNHIEIYENDSLVSVENPQRQFEMTEEVVEVIDSATARLKLTTYFEKEIPDKQDSTKFTKVSDSDMVEYIQNNRGVDLDLMPYDTASIERLEYNKKLYEQLAPRYPDEPVSEGFKWNNSIKVMLQNGETKDAISTYTVKGFVKEAGYDCAIIEFKSNSIVPFRTEYPNKDGKGVVIETRIDKRNSVGTAYFAYKEGIIVREDYSFDFLGEGTREKNKGVFKLKIVESASHSYHLISASGI